MTDGLVRHRVGSELYNLVRRAVVIDGAGGRFRSLHLCFLTLACLAVGCLTPGIQAVASAVLPDGRAWEMVSPLDKNGGDIRGILGDNGGGVVQSSASGNRITYVSLASFGTAQGASIGSQYFSERGPAGWQGRNISTPTNAH